jgi:hypothetical protein
LGILDQLELPKFQFRRMLVVAETVATAAKEETERKEVSAAPGGLAKVGVSMSPLERS